MQRWKKLDNHEVGAPHYWWHVSCGVVDLNAWHRDQQRALTVDSPSKTDQVILPKTRQSDHEAGFLTALHHGSLHYQTA